MFIVPFIHSVINNNSNADAVADNNFKIHTIKILTIGGQRLWEEDDALNIERDILNSNGIYIQNSITKYKKNIYLCDVDSQKTNVAEFYNWNEIELDDLDTFCWKTYYFFTDSTNAHTHAHSHSHWLEIPQNEMLDVCRLEDLILALIEPNNKLINV